MKPSIFTRHRIRRHYIPQAVIAAIADLGKCGCDGSAGLPAALEGKRFVPPRQVLRGMCRQTAPGQTTWPGAGPGGGRRPGVLLERRVEAKVSENHVGKHFAKLVTAHLFCIGLLCRSAFAEDACDRKFDTLRTGSTLNEVMLVLGKPDHDERVIVLGVEKRRLEWTCDGAVYRALLIGSRMLAKSSSRKSGFFSF